MFKKTKTSALANPVGRRAVLAKLGMVAGAAYVAPMLLSLSPAHASDSVSGASGNSYSAPSAQSYSAPSNSYSAPSGNSGSSFSGPDNSGDGGSRFSGSNRPRLAPNGMTWDQWWAMITGRG